MCGTPRVFGLGWALPVPRSDGVIRAALSVVYSHAFPARPRRFHGRLPPLARTVHVGGTTVAPPHRFVDFAFLSGVAHVHVCACLPISFWCRFLSRRDAPVVQRVVRRDLTMYARVLRLPDLPGFAAVSERDFAKDQRACRLPNNTV